MAATLILTLIIAALAAAGSIMGNWIKPPKNMPQWAIIALVTIIVIAGPALAFYVGSRKAAAAPVITAPVQNAQVDRETNLEGTLPEPLNEGHELWYDIHAYEENGFHFAEKPCDVIDGFWRCPTVFAGQAGDPAGKRFVITMYDCDRRGSQTLKGPAYAGRDKTARGAFDPQPMVQGCIAIASVVVKRV